MEKRTSSFFHNGLSMSVLSDAFSLEVSYLFAFENSVNSVSLVTLSQPKGNGW